MISFLIGLISNQVIGLKGFIEYNVSMGIEVVESR